MADDTQSIHHLNWRGLFPFTHLFRAFRVAIHPSKLVLGFALLFLLYAGGRVLDGIWPATHYAARDEINRYEEFRWGHDQQESFDSVRERLREENANHYSADLLRLNIVNDSNAAIDAARRGDYHSKIQSSIVKTRNDDLETARVALQNSLTALTSNATLNEVDRHREERSIRQRYDVAFNETQNRALTEIEQLNSWTPRPIFDTFSDYESRQFHHVVDNSLTWNWLNGVLGVTSHETAASNTGVIRSIANFAIIGPGWMLRYHAVYFILFATWFLVLWAIFGGAIARIAAVHVARDEKISVRQALRFSTSKLLSFVFAPIIPLIIILVLGILIAVGGMLMYLPVLGPIVVGLLFILALLAGFIITLVATGTVSGFNLMYSTIAVEGSDSFDAISRSFSYVFARPWRMLFYTAVSLVYGALCFIFVRYFVYVMLGFTHFFAQWFLWGAPARYFDEIWPAVRDTDLAYHINFQALAWSEATAAFFIAMWVYMVLALLAAFVISFYFSANTIIYFLMRSEVDATELDDVYLDETEEEFADAPVVASPSGTIPAAPDTSDAAPSATPPAPV